VDAHRFDRLVRTWHTRRAALGLAVGLGALLGLAVQDEAAAKRKKKCGSCRRRKRGKCKPKPDETRCGPCKVCQRGRCVALCPPTECSERDEGDVCLQECDPPCDTCNTCNLDLGQCELVCETEFCIDDFCRVPCDPPCGPCSYCEVGECVASCGPEECDDQGRCDIPCDPECDDDEECVAGECFPACGQPCGNDEGCVRGSSGNICVKLAGNCPAEDIVCQATACSVNGGFGSCVTTGDGVYCAQSLSCGCATDLDCRNDGFGPNSRCAADCAFCAGFGGFGCVRLAGE
jgi:hypothetical protein